MDGSGTQGDSAPASYGAGLVRKVIGLLITFLAWYVGLIGVFYRLVLYMMRDTRVVVGIVNFYYDLYPEYRPEETPVDKIYKHAYPAFSRVPDYVERLCIIVVENWIATVGIAAFLGFMRIYGAKPARRIIHSFRGIKPEAMIAGSHFVVGEAPKYQVPLYSVGMLYSSFVGYGLRVGDFLVAPYHVYEAAEKQMMFSNKVLISAAPIVSKVIKDLCYFPISPSTWGDLKVPKAGKPVSLVKAMPGGCVGQPGRTSGLLKPTKMFVGALEYTGSTMPGMSGAAYIDGTNRFLGMHLGAMGVHNVGVTATLISKEIKLIQEATYQGEASDDYVIDDTDLYEAYMWKEDMQNMKEFEREHQWEELEDRALNQKWSKDEEWSRFDEVDYDYDLDFENAPRLYVEKENDEIEEISIKDILEALKKARGKSRLEKKLSRPVKVKGQSPGGPEVDLADSFFKTETAVLRKRVDDLEKRLKDLEEVVEKGKSSPPQNPLKIVKCRTCNKVFKNEEFMEQHHRDSHKSSDLQPESAYASDNLVKMKVDRKKVPFLEKRRSQRVTSPRYGRTLNTLARGNPYQSLLESQSKMIDILVKLESSLSKDHKDMAGQSSERPRS